MNLLKQQLHKIALGGGCHWCTEAVFQSLKGVISVDQGYIASEGDQQSFSEAIIIQYDTTLITLKDLIEIHLYTHKSTVNHSMREKYRSAVYTYDVKQQQEAIEILNDLQKDFNKELITKVHPFVAFKASREQLQNYYYNNPEKPFCKTYIDPKLKLLLQRFSSHINHQKLAHIAL